MKMGSFLSVARGSEEPPKFLELHYNGLPDSKECIAFVGKGITFDRFGYCFSVIISVTHNFRTGEKQIYSVDNLLNVAVSFFTPLSVMMKNFNYI